MLASLGQFIASFSVSGLAAVRRQILAFVRAISTAMLRLPKIVLGATFRGLITSAQAAHKAVSRLMLRVGQLAKTVLGVGSIGAVGAIAGKGIAFKDAMKDSEEYIRTLEKISNTLDLPMETISVFAGYAAKFGFELEDARQAFTQFFGVAGEAQKGKNEYSAVFRQVGIDMTEARYRTMPMIELLQEFANKLQNFSGSYRTGILTALFGDDDATKVATLLDQMAKNPIINGTAKGIGSSGYLYGDTRSQEEWLNSQKAHIKNADGTITVLGEQLSEYEQLQKRMRDAGAIVSDRDVQQQQAFKASIEDVKMAFRGLQLTIFREFQPAVSALFRRMADWLIANRWQIVNNLKGAWNMASRAIHDFQVVFMGLPPQFQLTNRWMYRVRDAFNALKIGVSVAARVISAVWAGLPTVFAGVAEAASIMGDSLNRMAFRLMNETGNGITAVKLWKGETKVGIDDVVKLFDGMAQRIANALVYVAKVMSDIGSVLSFEDHNIWTDAGKRMRDWRDMIIGTVADLPGIIGDLIARVFAPLTTPFMAGFNSGDIFGDPSSIYKYGAAIRITSDLVKELIANLQVMWAGGDATGNFAWLNTVRAGFEHLTRAVAFAYNFITTQIAPAYQAMEKFLAYFNIDLGGTLLLLSLAKLFGLGGVISLLIGFVGTFISTLVSVLWAGLAPVIGAWLSSMAATLLAGLAALVAGVPVIILAAVVALLAGLVYMIWKNWDSYAEVFQTIIDVIGQTLKFAADIVMYIVGNTLNSLGIVFDAIGTIFLGLVHRIGQLGKLIFAVVTAIVKGIGDGFNALGEAFDILAGYFWGAVEMVGQTMAGIGSSIMSAVEFIGGAFARIGSGAMIVADGVRWAFGQIGNAFGMIGGAGQAAWGMIEQAWGGMISWFQDRIQAVVNFFKPAWENIAKFAKDAWGLIMKVWDQASPYFWAIVDPLMAVFKWLWSGISTAASAAWNILSGVWSGLVQFFQDPIGTIAKLWDALWGNIVKGAEWAFQMIKKFTPIGWGYSFAEYGTNVVMDAWGAGQALASNGSQQAIAAAAAPAYVDPSRYKSSSYPSGDFQTVKIELPGVKPIEVKAKPDAFDELKRHQNLRAS